LLGSVRSFGSARLREMDEETSTSRRHALWLANIADGIMHQPKAMSAEQGACLLAEIDNIRAAIAWSLNASQEDRDFAGRIISGLEEVWDFAGRGCEHRQWIEKALECTDEARHPLVVAHLLRGFIARTHYERVVFGAIDRAIALNERIGDRLTSIDLEVILTSVFAWHGKLGDADRSSERALALLAADQMLGSVWHANLLLCRSMLRMLQGRIDEARADVTEAEAIALSFGDRFFVVGRCYLRRCLIEHAAGNAPLALEMAQKTRIANSARNS
jgi:hypothetical protein